MSQMTHLVEMEYFILKNSLKKEALSPKEVEEQKNSLKKTVEKIKKHEKKMNTNEHTRECSFSENTRFPGEIAFL